MRLTTKAEVIAGQTVSLVNMVVSADHQILWSLGELAYKTGGLLQAAQWCKQPRTTLN